MKVETSEKHLVVITSWAAPGGGQGGQLPPVPSPCPPIFG